MTSASKTPAARSDYESARTSETYTASDRPSKTSNGDVPQALRYRLRALLLMGFYIPILVIPWVLTCVLVHHPVNEPTYYKQSGLPPNTIRLHRRLINGISILNTIAGIVTIPLISSLLAQAAVIYTQRRRKSQHVTVRQAFALADRGWSNISVLWDSWVAWSKGSATHGPGSKFLTLSAILLVIAAIQLPIREIFLSTEQTLVFSRSEKDVSIDYLQYFQPARYTYDLGHDPEPDDMSSIPEDLVVQDVGNSLASLSVFKFPPNLWIQEVSLSPESMLQAGPWNLLRSQRGYVAALPNGTTTGVMRHRIMRLNSSASCADVDQSEFPSQCGGENPFTASFLRPDQLQVRVCVPGSRGKFPWTVSRDRQQLHEEIFLDISDATGISQRESWNSSVSRNVTRHCTTQTERGYFELGNYRNRYQAGSLLDRWEEPDIWATEGEYNDWMSPEWIDDTEKYRYSIGRAPAGERRRPSTEDRITDLVNWTPNKRGDLGWPPVPGSQNPNRTMAGPLMTLAISLFGERSLFAFADASTNATSPSAAAQLCQSGRLPYFSRTLDSNVTSACANATATDVSPEQDEQNLINLMKAWLASILYTPDGTEISLGIGLYFANEAMLLQTVQNTFLQTARPITSSDGSYIPRPIISLTGMILVSVLILLQLLGLAYLTYYIYLVPAWTGALDALAVARIAKSLGYDDLPGIGAVEERDERHLGAIDGLVGIVEVGKECEDGVEVDGDKDGRVEIGLGASGLFHRRLAKFRIKRARPADSMEMHRFCECEGCTRRRANAAEGDASGAYSAL